MLHHIRKAVMLMHEGAYTEAYALLHAALDKLKNKVDLDLELSPQAADEARPAKAEAAIQPIPVKFHVSADKIVNNAFAFYSSAFVFTGSEEELDATSANEIRLAMLVLYNFGLCFHVQGINKAESQQYFARAMQMYQTALGLLEASSALLPDATDRDCLLLLALHNNIGHIHACDHKLGEVQDCLANIQRILATKTGHMQCDVTMPGLAYLDFHLNCLILHGTRRHSPAA